MFFTSSAPSPLLILFACGVAALVVALILGAIGGTAIDLNAVLGVALFVLIAAALGIGALTGPKS